MFSPVQPKVWRWETPDPEDHWVMIGHLLQEGDHVVLVDPPMVPKLTEALMVLGGVSAIILTTHDHTRGARYVSEMFSCPVYVPVQANAERIDQAGIKNTLLYDETTLLPAGLKAYRCQVEPPMWQDASHPYLDEMMLVTLTGAVACGDIVMGSADGRLWGCPEGFNNPADLQKVFASLNTFKRILPPSVDTLLSAHGIDIVGDLQSQLQQRLAN
ncbi:MAG: hypothetical protein C7B46_11475 [Sulfobacillus benefaciens]|uniref:Metallo-beta-lactamase domain-containing protein n=1 Tax=Sulfobacillus benefaciens TaxID=453960 RepID=A0A2T2XF14_9FIRM|nr:MAG: hypothetical protein C7B46_11475 [Sulfobacillus benefaciens]